MARITVEDCLHNVENRFELVLVAGKRARQMQTGGKKAMLPEEHDKPTVIALREIADGLVDASILIDTGPEEEEKPDAAPAESAETGEGHAPAAKGDISIEDAMDAELIADEAAEENAEASPADPDDNTDEE